MRAAASNESSLLPEDRERRRFVNVARADELLGARGIDAMVAAHPVNVYYVSSFWTLLQKMGYELASLALHVRGRPQLDALVVSSAQIWRVAAGETEHPARLYAYTGPANWQAALAAPPGETLRGAPSIAWPAAQEPALSTIERAWMRASRRLEGKEAPTSLHAMAQALREAGLERAHLATDDARIGPGLAAAGLDSLRISFDPNLFRRLRVVKSEPELALMQIAARNNAQACLDTLRAVRPGTTAREIEAEFSAQAARRGSERVFVAVGGTGSLPHGHVVAGQPFLIDAVSHYRGYHGDFGRTAFVGEPDRETRRRVDALRVGWHAAFEALRPGRRYEQVRTCAFEAMRKSGYGDVLTVANPHSVGLQHTDEPFRDGLPWDVKDDLVLEENMTLTVDFPHIHVGWGAAHLEDLVRITRDGAEPLGAMDEPLIEL